MLLGLRDMLPSLCIAGGLAYPEVDADADPVADDKSAADDVLAELSSPAGIALIEACRLR